VVKDGTLLLTAKEKVSYHSPNPSHSDKSEIVIEGRMRIKSKVKAAIHIGKDIRGINTTKTHTSAPLRKKPCPDQH
jgi:hypothetical protein